MTHNFFTNSLSFVPFISRIITLSTICFHFRVIVCIYFRFCLFTSFFINPNLTYSTSFNFIFITWNKNRYFSWFFRGIHTSPLWFLFNFIAIFVICWISSKFFFDTPLIFWFTYTFMVVFIIYSILTKCIITSHICSFITI
jgi:hypothetical protein